MYSILFGLAFALFWFWLLIYVLAGLGAGFFIFGFLFGGLLLGAVHEDYVAWKDARRQQRLDREYAAAQRRRLLERGYEPPLHHWEAPDDWDG